MANGCFSVPIVGSIHKCLWKFISIRVYSATTDVIIDGKYYKMNYERN